MKERATSGRPSTLSPPVDEAASTRCDSRERSIATKQNGRTTRQRQVSYRIP